MNLQYISDNKGQTAGVFIPIQDWNQLKKKYQGLEKKNRHLIFQNGIKQLLTKDLLHTKLTQLM